MFFQNLISVLAVASIFRYIGKKPWVIELQGKKRDSYSKTKTSWHLWAEHDLSSTMPNFHLRAVFFVMESNIAYNLKSK